MGLLSVKKTSYLGVDIGTASIKLVQLTQDNHGINLDTFGYVDVVSDIIHDNTPESKQKLIDVLKKLISQANVTTTQAIAALPTFAVFTSVVNLPKLPSKELAAAIRVEAKKYVPLPLEEMVLDWRPIKSRVADPSGVSLKTLWGKKAETGAASEETASGGKIVSQVKEYNKVLITAAPKALVDKYLEIFKGAGLNLISLETEALAISRALVAKDNELTMIVDIGSVTTDICVIEDQVPALNRSIDVGGLAITKAIAASLNIDEVRAEQFKRDLGAIATDLQKNIPKAVEASLYPIINEIRYVFDLYRGQSTRGVEKIILSGGSVFIPNLSDYFLRIFNVPVYIGNPWDKLNYPEELKDMLERIGNRMAVAVGLALRDV
jgi:type IV pilus assembly protein PilM